ncbi:MAG TPA: HAD hydrolase-like protein [bacterium]
MSPINYGPSDVHNPRGVPFGGMVPESFWMTKALLFDFDWVVQDSKNPNFTKEDYPEESPLAALKNCYRTLRNFEVRTAVTSNLAQKEVVASLAEMNLTEDFDNIRCFEDVTELKPKTELHLLSLDMMGVKAARAVAFETTIDGVNAAKEAKIYCVGKPGLEGHADMILNSFIEIPLLHVLEKIDRAKREQLSKK